MTGDNMVTLHEVQVAMAEVVNEKGRDFVYERAYTTSSTSYGCYYYPLKELAEDGLVDPHQGFLNFSSWYSGCLVGETLRKLNILNCPKGYGGPVVVDGESGWFSKQLEKETLEFLRVAQRVQDSERTWGEALDEAEEWLFINILRR